MKPLLTALFGYVGSKTDGYKTKIGGIGLILTALVGLLGQIWPDQGLPQMSVEAIFGMASAGMTALGLGGKAEKLKKAIQDQSGRVACLLPISLTLIIGALLILPLLSGCAIHSESTATTAARSLLSAQTVVVGLAQAADSMCSQGTLNQDQCDQVRALYQQAGVTYDVAAEALIVAIESGEEDGSAAWANYHAIRGRLTTLLSALQAAAKEYGIADKVKELIQ